MRPSRAISVLTQAVDWEAVASEFETVAGRYRSAVYRHGRRIMRNLRRPYMLYRVSSPDYRSATSPWPTIETLIEAANVKIQRGRELKAAGNADFNASGRVYPWNA